MSPLHTLLVHCPKMQDHFGPLGPAMSINCMAVGLPALAAVVAGTGRPTEILHLGVQQRAEPGFDLGAEVRRLKPVMAGLSLHWHPQTWDTIAAARAIKAAHPSTTVVLGGMTASVFHDQILAEHPCIDAVIKGDGEEPLRALAEALDAGSPLSGVPNLSWREGETVRSNAIGYVADAATLSTLDYERFDLLRHHQSYIRHFSGVHYQPLSRPQARMMQLAQRIFGGAGRYMVMPAGRGCSVNCAWCGGGFGAHRRYADRPHYSMLPAGRLAALMARALELGFNGVHACFDPTPKDPTVWVDAFERLRRSKARCGLLFESFAVPHPDLVASIAETFHRRIIAISPESADEGLRHKVRGLSFSNEDLLAAVESCARHRVDVMLCFGLGLPGETVEALAAARALTDRCRAVGRGIRILCRTFPIHMEPGAPWSRNPERYGISLTRERFADYLRAHTPGYTGPEVGLGYRHTSYFPEGSERFEARLQEEACRELCPLPPSPTLGRHTCRVLRSLHGSAAGSCR